MHLATTILMLTACQTKPLLTGTVVDVWGNPVEGATVIMVGNTSERPLTDADGRYELKRIAGVHQFKAGRDGYIQQHMDFTVSSDANQAGPIFTLYPKPEQPGFYVVGTTRYHKLQAETVKSKGNQLKTLTGIESSGEATAEGTKLKVVFHNDLKLDEIMRLGLSLHEMDYVATTELPGPLGSRTEATMNLYVASEKVPLDLQPMRSQTDYLITTKKPLDAGTYAFVTQDLLSPKDIESFAKIPDSLRVAFPVTIR